METKMKTLFKSFATAALMLAFAATASAQNSGAAREMGVSGAGTARAGASTRGVSVAETSPGGDRSRMPGTTGAPHSASAASGRPWTTPENHGASAPDDHGVTRGGPDNPSGLKKPD